jgi:hypothetical protein
MKQTFVRLLVGLMFMGSMLFSGTSGMVLCFGEDGHFALEPTHHGHGGCPYDADGCGHQDADPSSGDANWQSRDACYDLPLDIETASLVTKDLQTKRLLIREPASLLPFIGDPVPAFHFVYRRNESPGKAWLRIAPSVLAKRTIVLRI